MPDTPLPSALQPPFLLNIGGIRFVSLSTEERTYLDPVKREHVFQTLCNSPDLELLQLVIMPEHLHGLLRGRNCACQVTELVGPFTPAWSSDPKTRIIQGRADLRIAYRYIRENPLVRGLSTEPERYPWYFERPDLRLLIEPGELVSLLP